MQDWVRTISCSERLAQSDNLYRHNDVDKIIYQATKIRLISRNVCLITNMSFILCMSVTGTDYYTTAVQCSVDSNIIEVTFCCMTKMESEHWCAEHQQPPSSFCREKKQKHAELCDEIKTDFWGVSMTGNERTLFGGWHNSQKCPALQWP